MSQRLEKEKARLRESMELLLKLEKIRKDFADLAGKTTFPHVRSLLEEVVKNLKHSEFWVNCAQLDWHTRIQAERHCFEFKNGKFILKMDSIDNGKQ